MRQLLSKSLATLLFLVPTTQAQEVTKLSGFYQRIYSGETSRIDYFLFEGENVQMQLPVKSLAVINKEAEALLKRGDEQIHEPATEEQTVPHVLFLDYKVIKRRLYDTRGWGTSIGPDDSFLAFATNLPDDAYARLREATIREVSNINAPSFSPKNIDFDWPLFAAIKDELVASGKPGSQVTVYLQNESPAPVLQFSLLNDEEMREVTGEEPPFTPEQRYREVAESPLIPEVYSLEFVTTGNAILDNETRPILFESQTVLHNIKKQTIDLIISKQDTREVTALPDWVSYAIVSPPGPRRAEFSQHHAAFYSSKYNEFHIVDVGSGELPIPTWNTRGVFSRVVLYSNVPKDEQETTLLFGTIATPSPRPEEQYIIPFNTDAFKRAAKEELDKAYLLSPQSVKNAFARASKNLARGNSYVIVCKEDDDYKYHASVYFGEAPVAGHPTNGQEVCEALDQITPIN